MDPDMLHVGDLRGSQCGVHVQHAAVLGLHPNGQAKHPTLIVIVPGDSHIGEPPHGLVAVADRHGDALLLDMHEHLHDWPIVPCLPVLVLLALVRA